MCGINGILEKNNNQRKQISEVLSAMNQEIIHRGPDEDGFFLEKTDSYSMGMGMRRLSIIDLSTGKQPISSDDGEVTIVFNGEIYNYRSLRKMLQDEKVNFHTTSDTEVILHLYEKYGTDAFSMLDGMFAFSIYDRKLDKIFIARDYFGEKPLYFTQTDHEIFWASELKSVLRVLDRTPDISKEGMNLYFRLTYIPAPYSIYENINKLEANHFLEIDCCNFRYSIHEIKQNFEKNISTDITFHKSS